MRRRHLEGANQYKNCVGLSRKFGAPHVPSLLGMSPNISIEYHCVIFLSPTKTAGAAPYYLHSNLVEHAASDGEGIIPLAHFSERSRRLSEDQ
jgi:hypothetical protein